MFVVCSTTSCFSPSAEGINFPRPDAKFQVTIGLIQCEIIKSFLVSGRLAKPTVARTRGHLNPAVHRKPRFEQGSTGKLRRVPCLFPQEEMPKISMRCCKNQLFSLKAAMLHAECFRKNTRRNSSPPDVEPNEKELRRSHRKHSSSHAEGCRGLETTSYFPRISRVPLFLRFPFLLPWSFLFLLEV